MHPIKVLMTTGLFLALLGCQTASEDESNSDEKACENFQWTQYQPYDPCNNLNPNWTDHRDVSLCECFARCDEDTDEHGCAKYKSVSYNETDSSCLTDASCTPEKLGYLDYRYHICPDSNECGPKDCSSSEEVQQPGTDIYWLRCPAGQTWDGDSCACTGIVTTRSWTEAVETCPTNYRMPTVEEFENLLEWSATSDQGRSCDGSEGETTCTKLFGWDSFEYWSSTVEEEEKVWLFSFRSGKAIRTTAPNGGTCNVRCIRQDEH